MSNSSKYVFVDGSTIKVQRLRTEPDGRSRWQYVIRDTDGTRLFKGRDFQSGCFIPATPDGMLDVLASYLTAWLEALQYGSDYSENRDLFPSHLEPWATEHQTELEMLACDQA